MLTVGIVGEDMLVEIEAWAEVGSGDKGVFRVEKILSYTGSNPTSRCIEIVLIVPTILTDKDTYNNRTDPKKSQQKIQKSDPFFLYR